MDSIIPKITEEQVKEQFKLINDLVVGGTLTRWLDEELEKLHNENPVLYGFIVERSHKFAMGAIMTHEPQSIAISFALEYMILLKIVGISFGKTLGLETFANNMSKWLGKNGKIEGLDEFGNDKNRDKSGK